MSSVQVIEESKAQLLLAEQLLCSVRMAYPEVLASIRTKQVAQEMLLVKEAYVHELKASGTFIQHTPTFHSSLHIKSMSTLVGMPAAL